MSLARAILVVTLTLTGCGSTGSYLTDRALDLTDVIDVKYGLAWGVGAKVEATNYVGAGLGAAESPYYREWFGRMSIVSDGAFLHLLLFGFEGASIHGSFPDGSLIVGFVDVATLGADRVAAPRDGYEPSPESRWPGTFQRWRVGGELLAGVQLGLYLNLGELADFVLGLGTLDIADDDGIPKGRLARDVPWRRASRAEPVDGTTEAEPEDESTRPADDGES